VLDRAFCQNSCIIASITTDLNSGLDMNSVAMLSLRSIRLTTALMAAGSKACLKLSRGLLRACAVQAVLVIIQWTMQYDPVHPVGVRGVRKPVRLAIRLRSRAFRVLPCRQERP
jgi:hypothetical protein